MRVGILIYGLDRPFSGIGRYTVELVRALSDASDEIEIILLVAGDAGPLAESSGHQKVRLPGCRFLPGLGTIGNAVILRQAARFGLDLVHDPTGLAPFLLGADGASTVVTIHDVFPLSFPGTSTILENIIYRYWLPRVLPRVDAVITDSQASRMDIERFLSVPAPKLHVVYAGVSGAYRSYSNLEVAEVRSRFRLPESYIFSLGSVQKRKNFHGLLQAYAKVRKMGEKRPLVAAGTNRLSNREITSELQRLDLQAHVIFLGYVPEADLAAIYSAADLFVFPSFYEGFGLPILEAMACGTPVVTSDVSSLPEVAGEAALLVDPYDAEKIAEAMRRILQDEDKALDLSSRGLERVKHFTWGNTAREILSVYQKI